MTTTNRPWTKHETQAYRDYILEHDFRIRALRKRSKHMTFTM
jgi:hypothetical protein